MTKRAGLLAAIALCCSVTMSASQTPSLPAFCPPWVNSGAGHANSATPDLGCANRRNLKIMLDNDADLTLGRELGPGDAEREGMAVRNYEQGKVKETGSTTSTPGALLIPSTPAQGNAQ